jgi:hypothetical protein
MSSESPNEDIAYTGPTNDGLTASEALLRRALSTLEHARPMPLSTSSMVNSAELSEMITDAVERLPDELRAARWLLKEREEFLAKARRESDEILDVARRRAERMVERTEVAKAAEGRARRIVEQAEADARRVRLQLEDFCDQKLNALQAMLDKTQSQIDTGRANLRPVQAETAAPTEQSGDPEESNFFDQDTSD